MDEQLLNDRARQALQQRAEGLDGATLSKLRQARAHAVEQGLKRRHSWLTLWLPATGLATAAAALLAVNLWYGHAQAPDAPDPGLLESLAHEEMAQPIDDLDFYDWLGSGNGGSA
jgi:hypothetical protein